MSYQQQLMKDILNADAGKHNCKGVQVYHNNYVENGIRALSISFPTLVYFIEQANFRALAKAYLLAHPKTQFDWADYGKTLPQFLLSHPIAVKLPYLTEVAELDWLIHELGRCVDKPFDGESFTLISELDLSQLVFEPAPGFNLATFFFPVMPLYRLANEPTLALAGPERDAFMQSLTVTMGQAKHIERAGTIMLWRPDYKAEMLCLSESEAGIFTQIAKKQSIATVFSHFSDQPQQIPLWLSEQIVKKRIYGVRAIG